MKIALIGFGNMGKELKRAIDNSSDLNIVSISFKNRNEAIDIKNIRNADVAIDFSSPDIVLENIKKVAQLGIPMVIGTTGWYDYIEKVKAMVQAHNIGLVYGQNFSIGANIFFKIIERASQLFRNFDYDAYGFEIHHRQKKDSPSGTAKKIGQLLIENFSKKHVMQTEKLDRKIKDEEFHFASIRGGRNPGFHEVVFDSFADEVRISHSAHNREGFALGAILAARFISKRKGFYSFDKIFEKGVK